MDKTIDSAEVQVAEYFRKRGSSTRNKLEFDCFQLTNAKHERVIVVGAIDCKETYFFSMPRTILVESASYWKSQKLQLLGMEIVPENDFLSTLSEHFFSTSSIPPDALTTISAESDSLLNSLNHVDYKTKLDDETVVIEDLTTLEKALLVMQKYPEVEAAVDLMITFLLELCGFYKKRLFAFPQFPFKIQFGDVTADAKPDFTIFDLRTYYRIAVIEDKCELSESLNLDVEAQLMAEAIAMAQANRAKSKKDNNSPKRQAVDQETTVLGIKVRGKLFTFYLIPVTGSVLHAMDSRLATTARTVVKKSNTLDLLIKDDRKTIIQLLLFYRLIAEVTGNGVLENLRLS